MQLYTRRYSDSGAPLVILHGLFGNQGNWAWQAKELSADYAVVGVDLRNHGRSPHAPEHDYARMAADVAETLNALQLDRVHLLGHSMGGKVAMECALLYPGLFLSLVVVDIAPVGYPPDEYMPLKALNAVDLATLENRSQAADVLAHYLDTEEVIEFLLTGLQRDSTGSYTWRFNLDALTRHYDEIRGWPKHDTGYPGPVLFVKGADSDYITGGTRSEILRLFPAAQLKVIEGAGHWPHSEKPWAFLKILQGFLAEVEARP